jgi:MYXO-CTERM domain-containing protein
MRRWLIAVVLACSTQALAAPGATQTPVTNALPDPGDPAVVALVNTSDQLVCTAAIIAPHVALTAAHCIAGKPLTLRAFFGNTIADGGTFDQVTDARAHPQFDPGGNDVALVTLADAAPVTPLPLAPPLDGSFVGTGIRVVGFGTIGNAGGDGVKRLGTARVAALGDADFIAVPDLSLSCLGDSGGPGLVAGDAIAGVVSRVDSQCVDHAVYTRIDVAQDILIQPYLDEMAAGAAGEGEPCFYDGHCAAGLECTGDTARTCEPPDSGCGCHSSEPRGVLVILAIALATRRRSSRRTP